MGRIRVLDPTAPPPEVDPQPGPDAGDLAGKRVGLRYDSAWRSWLWVLDEWQPRFEAAGASVVRWSAGNRIGDEGAATFAALDRFADDVDVALVGLGN
jgi:hypothetical protein